MGKVQVSKELAHYDSTHKRYDLITGKQAYGSEFVSNGAWLLNKKYITPSAFEKYIQTPLFTDDFLRRYENEHECQTFPIDYTKFVLNEETGNYEYHEKNVNLYLERIFKEKILDKIYGKNITLVYYQTIYIMRFIYVYDKDKFIGLIVTEYDK